MEEDFYNKIDNLHEIIRKEEPEVLLSDEQLICECNCVSARDIRDFFQESKTVDLQLLQNKYDFGSGCGTCVKNKNHWVRLIFAKEL